jgi:hypothetical protein
MILPAITAPRIGAGGYPDRHRLEKSQRSGAPLSPMRASPTRWGRYYASIFPDALTAGAALKHVDEVPGVRLHDRPDQF